MTPDPLVAPVVGGTPEQLRWEAAAARSAATFVTHYAKAYCRHTEAVSECPHCNLNFLASYATRAADYFDAALVPRPEPREPESPLKLRSATESVGWVNSVGPLAVSPTFEKFDAAVRPASAPSLEPNDDITQFHGPYTTREQILHRRVQRAESDVARLIAREREAQERLYELSKQLDAAVRPGSAPSLEPHMITAVNDVKNRALWPDPTPEMLNDPAFETIWQVIKTWDINVPSVYAGYMGATGNHVRAILDALEAASAPSRPLEEGLDLAPFRQRLKELLEEGEKHLQHMRDVRVNYTDHSDGPDSECDGCDDIFGECHALKELLAEIDRLRALASDPQGK